MPGKDGRVRQISRACELSSLPLGTGERQVRNGCGFSPAGRGRCVFLRGGQGLGPSSPLAMRSRRWRTAAATSARSIGDSSLSWSTSQARSSSSARLEKERLHPGWPDSPPGPWGPRDQSRSCHVWLRERLQQKFREYLNIPFTPHQSALPFTTPRCARGSERHVSIRTRPRSRRT